MRQIKSTLFLALCFTAIITVPRTARANWGTSSAMPYNLSGAEFDPGDGANLRNQTYICTWMPDNNEPGWYDTAGWRANHCDGAPGVGDVDVITTSGKYCTRVHGLVSTDAEPNGFRLGWQYIRWVGFYGVDMDDWWIPEQIGSFVLGPNSHVTFCPDDLKGTPATPCFTAPLQFRTDGTVTAGTLPFIVAGFAVGTNEAIPAPCPLTAAVDGFVPCPGTYDKSGLRVFIGGDHLTRAGGFAIVGNPITGPSGKACLSHDGNGQVAVAVYPIPGPQVPLPGGGTASTPLCP